LPSLKGVIVMVLNDLQSQICHQEVIHLHLCCTNCDYVPTFFMCMSNILAPLSSKEICNHSIDSYHDFDNLLSFWPNTEIFLVIS